MRIWREPAFSGAPGRQGFARRRPGGAADRVERAGRHPAGGGVAGPGEGDRPQPELRRLHARVRGGAQGLLWPVGPVRRGLRARARAGRPGDDRGDGAGQRGLLRDLGHGRGGVSGGSSCDFVFSSRATGQRGAMTRVSDRVPASWPDDRPSCGSARRSG
ncbi:MAG: hypothetical protein C0426_14960 [Rhodobacter sp.]|nr:hypothetical protein [Rhodobacter sp.]